MNSLDEIIDMARRLTARDRTRLLKELEDLLAVEEPLLEEPSGEGPYSALLEMAGTVHSEFTDVSTDKYKHLAKAYSDQHREG